MCDTTWTKGQSFTYTRAPVQSQAQTLECTYSCLVRPHVTPARAMHTQQPTRKPAAPRSSSYTTPLGYNPACQRAGARCLLSGPLHDDAARQGPGSKRKVLAQGRLDDTESWCMNRKEAPEKIRNRRHDGVVVGVELHCLEMDAAFASTTAKDSVVKFCVGSTETRTLQNCVALQKYFG